MLRNCTRVVIHTRAREIPMFERKGKEDGKSGEGGRKQGPIDSYTPFSIEASSTGLSRLSRLGWLIFTWGVPLAHNHPPLSLSAKISKNTGISLYTEGTERGEGEGRRGEVISLKCITRPRPGCITNSPVISRHDLSRSRVRAVVDEEEEREWTMGPEREGDGRRK